MAREDNAWEGGDSYVYDGECCTGGGRVHIMGSAFGKGGECMFMTGNAWGGRRVHVYDGECMGREESGCFCRGVK